MGGARPGVCNLCPTQNNPQNPLPKPSSCRFLRNITVGQGKEERGQERATGFDITVASEIMAVLALASDVTDMRERLGRMVIGNSRAGRCIGAIGGGGS